LDVLTACVVGTALCSSSAAAFNQIVELDQDKRMKRTQQRPLVTGTLTIPQATTAATLWGAAGGTILYAGTDVLTTCLGVGNLVLYSGIYTAMKPMSVYNTWVGALVGAIPPVMGWSAATGGSICDPEAILLGLTLYLWQMPHFFALSFMHRVDYKRGGFQMVPCLEEDGRETASLIVRYAWYLSTVPFISTAVGVTSSMFALEGIALNAYALSVAHKFQRDRTNGNARKVFLTSLWYLPCLLMLFLLHSKVWDDEKEKDDAIARYLADYIHVVRNKGRELCLHEAAVSKTVEGEKACPVAIGSKKSREGVETASAIVVAATAATATNLSESSASTSSKQEA
jgi:heme o synthase